MTELETFTIWIPKDIQRALEEKFLGFNRPVEHGAYIVLSDWTAGWHQENSELERLKKRVDKLEGKQ